MISETGMGRMVPSAAMHSDLPAADGTALIWGCFVAGFGSSNWLLSALLSVGAGQRGRAGWRRCPALLEEISGHKPEATIAGGECSCFLTRVNLCRGVDFWGGHCD